ncbi:sugar phosphate isomerase/epimerase [Oscillospiraceae bacterium OttesenSCG-928-G22]|nr:sugar phosphate isomerase/epimerase [Oscillospiraceae bacterium OttesenSCG-928-G22]
MKLSFSTVGCPNWTFQEILSAAKDLGYDGIELRGLGEDIYTPDIKIFRPENREETRNALRKAGIEIPIIASDCVLSKKDADMEKRIESYIDLASALGASYIRLLGDEWGEPGEGIDDGLVLSRLRSSAPYAKEMGVTLLVESNGVYADSARLRKLLDDADSSAIQALWDLQHPVRNFDEAPETTFGNIGPYVRHVHVKDSAFENGALVYKMLGYGTLPVRESLDLLQKADYAGYISLEWVKRWNRELEDAGVVFSHFIYSIKRMLRK